MDRLILNESLSLDDFLKDHEKFNMRPQSVTKEEMAHISKTADTLLTKRVKPIKWENIQAHHLESIERDLSFMLNNSNVNEVRSNPSLMKKYAVFVATLDAKNAISSQTKSIKDKPEDIPYWKDVIGNGIQDSDVYMLKRTASVLGLLTIDNNIWLEVNNQHDAICAATVSATDEKPWGNHCDEIPDLPNRQNSNALNDEDITGNDMNDIYLQTLRDLVERGEFKEDLREIEKNVRYQISGKLLFDRHFWRMLNMANAKYQLILMKKAENSSKSYY